MGNKSTKSIQFQIDLIDKVLNEFDLKAPELSTFVYILTYNMRSSASPFEEFIRRLIDALIIFNTPTKLQIDATEGRSDWIKLFVRNQLGPGYNMDVILDEYKNDMPSLFKNVQSVLRENSYIAYNVMKYVSNTTLQKEYENILNEPSILKY